MREDIVRGVFVPENIAKGGALLRDSYPVGLANYLQRVYNVSGFKILGRIVHGKHCLIIKIGEQVMRLYSSWRVFATIRLESFEKTTGLFVLL